VNRVHRIDALYRERTHDSIIIINNHINSRPHYEFAFCLLGPVVTVFRPPPYGLTAHHPSAHVWNAPVGGAQCFGYPCPPSPLHAGRVNIVVTVGRGARKTLTRRAHTKQPLPAAFVGPPVRRNICATTRTNSSFSSRSLSLSLTLFLSTSMQLSLRFSLLRPVCVP